MKRLLLCTLLLITFNAEPRSSEWYVNCELGAKTYAPYAVYFGKLIKMLQDGSSKMNKKERNELADWIKKQEEETTDREIEKIRQVASLLVTKGSLDYLSAQLYREIMEICYYKAMILGAENPNRSELAYKRLIEDECRTGK